MFLQKIKSHGISHLSYIIGDKGRAAVIDPRRDCAVYLEIAHQQGARITHIFETHRNEDYVIGSKELADLTGAEIFHGAELPFAYGRVTSEGDRFELGNIILEIMKTPGHTFESISLVLYDSGFGPDPVAVFTGDALFIGDVGRTDFFPDQKEETASLLYDSLFNKILPLGDHVILYPAHGSGSVCGSGMADREFSTLGYERLSNPLLKVSSRDEFIRIKTAESHSTPPYFAKMEEYNLNGPPALGALYSPAPMNAHDFENSLEQGMLALDLRSAQAFAGAFIPGSLCIPLNMVPAYAGWLLSYESDLGLIVDSPNDLDQAVRFLSRIGYDRVKGYLYQEMEEWSVKGKYFDSIRAVFAGEIQHRISSSQSFTLLDVRTSEEFQAGHLPGTQHIFLGELEKNLDKIRAPRPLTTFCGSGQRAIIAASILKKNGFQEVENCFGSMQACSQGVCEIVKE
ncbi:MAG: MBL fold metallo-hydrolase [Desulfonatronovibrio sp.]